MVMVSGICFESLTHSELNTENEAFWVLNVSVVHLLGLLGGSLLAQDKEPSHKSPYFILSPSFNLSLKDTFICLIVCQAKIICLNFFYYPFEQ